MYVEGSKLDYSMGVISELQKYESTESVDNVYLEPLKAKNLDIYLTTLKRLGPKAILIGDCPVYIGSRKTGIPFTDEYKIGNEEITLLQQSDEQGYVIMREEQENVERERVAQIMWEGLQSQISDILLWNMFPFYVHEAGCYEKERDLTEEELEQGYEYLTELLQEFPSVEVIVVAGEQAAAYLRKKEELKENYRMSYTSHPSLSAKKEFIARVKSAIAFKEHIYEKEEENELRNVSYEFRRGWAPQDQEGNFYCRALHRILPEKMEKYCDVCPCNKGSRLYCGYYTFAHKNLVEDPRGMMERYDLLMQSHLVPKFPDFILRDHNGGFLLEQAYQFVANLNGDSIYEEENIPYLFHSMENVAKFFPYAKNLEMGEEFLTAVVLHYVIEQYKVPPGRIEKEFGELVLSYIDKNDKLHEDRIARLKEKLKKQEIPEFLLDKFQQMFELQ